MTRFVVAMAVATATGVAPGSKAEDPEVPSAYTKLEYLVGSWKGQATPKDKAAQRFRGWPEKHAWAWTFQKGKPVGLKLTIEGGKSLSSATLTFDPERKQFHLEGIKPEPSSGDGPLVFDGNFDSSGKKLELAQVTVPGDRGGNSSLRISIRPNSDFVRYTMTFDRKNQDSAAYIPISEVGLTKEGESFAAGSNETERPKCIVTGGAAAMTVSYQGASYPICCSGCRDEFNENPAKYLEKARMIAASATSKTGSSAAASRSVSRFDDAFSKADSSTTPNNTPAAMTAKGSSTRPSAGPKSESSKAPRPNERDEATSPALAQTAARAATLLRLGQNLEKSGNTVAALKYFRQVSKDFATTPAAKTAAARIKALELK